MINPKQLTEYIIEPTLKYFDLYTPAAAQLLLGTTCVEAKCGHYIHQVGGGPAKGIYQMEPNTHNDIWNNYIKYSQDLKDKIERMIGREGVPDPELLICNLDYATIMCRLHYRRVKSPLPVEGDWYAMALYWKKHYNTELGAGTPEKFMKAIRDCGVIV